MALQNFDFSSDFRYVMCPGSMPHKKYESLYQKVYDCWRETWSLAFDELGVKKTLHSDAFTRQDYVGALFHKDECFALSFFRWTEAQRSEFSQDSYFSNWGPDHLKVLCSRGDRIVVCSNFTVHPRGRGKTLGISGKDLLMGMIVETFMNSQSDGMTGAVRVDRGVNGAGERWGAFVIERKVPCDYGEKNTDLIGFFKDHISAQADHDLHELTRNLWERRLMIPRQEISEEFAPILHVQERVA